MGKPVDDITNVLRGPSHFNYHPDNPDNNQAMFEYENSTPRQLLFDEVTELDNDQCSLTTSLRTNYRGWNTASGIMFTIQPSNDAIELLTLEFPSFETYGSSSAARKVKVYYRTGSFSGVMNNPSEWTLLADTSARIISPSFGSIKIFIKCLISASFSFNKSSLAM